MSRICLITNNDSILSKYDRISTVEALLLFKDYGHIQVDLETEGFDEHSKAIISMQLGSLDGLLQIVIDAKTVDILQFKDLIESRPCLFQNAKFDLKFLYKAGIIPKIVRDTFLAECVLTTGLENRNLALDSLAFKYCDVVLDKSVRGDIHREGLSDRVIRYGADDVKYLSDIYAAQYKRIVSEDLQRTLLLEEQYVRVLAYTEYCGFKLDPVKWIINTNNNQKLLDEQQIILNDMIMEHDIKEFINIAGDLFPEDKLPKISWSSTKQVTRLMNILGVDTLIKIKDGWKDTIDSKHLKKFKSKHILIPQYLKYSELGKQVSTYGKKFLKHININTGRLHSTYWQILNTGRISSKEPNLQNITADKEVRACFIPESGNVLIVSDYSAQETRVLADQANEINYLNFFLNGDGDSHSMVASRMFSQIEGKPIKVSSTENTELRQIGKVLSFQIAYGASAWSVKDAFGITQEKAQQFIDAYLNSFPDLKIYFEKRKKEVLANGYIITDDVSRRRIYMDRWEDYIHLRNQIEAHKRNRTDAPRELIREYYIMRGQYERIALNYPIQSIAASMTKLAGVKMFNWIEANGLFGKVKIVSFIHDEMCVECPKDIAAEVAKACQESMESAAAVFVKKLPIPAKPNITDFWKK